ncbi:nphp3 [Symbiodinium microadriaticum]|nr:nphp3 [Symbiodinium microadriaticum]
MLQPGARSAVTPLPCIPRALSVPRNLRAPPGRSAWWRLLPAAAPVFVGASACRAILGDAANRARRLQDENLPVELKRRKDVVAQLRDSATPDAVVAALDDLGVAFLAIGESAKAEEAFRRAFQLCQASALDTDSLWAANNLAVALKAQGPDRYREAQKLYQETLEARLRNDPDEKNPSTFTSLNNLAVLLKVQGQVVEAERMYRRALQRRRAVLGNTDPDTLTSINNLASLLSVTGQTEEAESLYAEALAGCRAKLGNKDMDTLLSADNLASLLFREGRAAEAEPLFREAALGLGALLGARHPETLRTLDNLAVALSALGRLEEAEKMLRATVQSFRETLGPDHPDTLVAEDNLRSIMEERSAEDIETMRSDLYLFEVLQNAVDDGALHVSFEPTQQGLSVKHDGRRFTALDVLGLSSVGLSTKATCMLWSLNPKFSCVPCLHFIW